MKKIILLLTVSLFSHLFAMSAFSADQLTLVCKSTRSNNRVSPWGFDVRINLITNEVSLDSADPTLLSGPYPKLEKNTYTDGTKTTSLEFLATNEGLGQMIKIEIKNPVLKKSGWWVFKKKTKALLYVGWMRNNAIYFHTAPGKCYLD